MTTCHFDLADRANAAPLWQHFAELVSKACGAKAAAIARLNGAQIHYVHTVGMEPFSRKFPDPCEAFKALQALPSEESRRELGHAATEILHLPDGSPVGALLLFCETPTASPFLSSFARHAEELLVRVGWNAESPGRKCSAEDLCGARDAADAANAAKDQFIAKLSHELRTPLTPVLMGIDMLLNQTSLEASLQRELVAMQQHVQLEARLIDDLLDLTRIVHGKLDLHLEEVDVHRLLDQAVQICAPLATRRGVSICLRLEAGEYWTGGDPARLVQVFWNLLQNSMKFTPPGGTIQIATQNPAPGRIAIAIRDNGIGIDPASIPGLFNAFEQGANKATEGQCTGGLGLGLAICKGVVELHGGSIQALSEGVGLGASFVVELETHCPPAVLPSPNQSYVQTGPSPELVIGSAAPGDCPVHLLVVEDHPNTGDLLARLLRRAGYAVTLAPSVAEAKVLARENRFALVLSDIGLPDGNGRDLMSYLRDQYGLSGIALSGFGTEADAQASLEAGFVEHVVKPVEWEQLSAALRRVLHRGMPRLPSLNGIFSRH